MPEPRRNQTVLVLLAQKTMSKKRNRDHRREPEPNENRRVRLVHESRFGSSLANREIEHFKVCLIKRLSTKLFLVWVVQKFSVRSP